MVGSPARGEESITQDPIESLARLDTITSELGDSHYAVLPHGISLEGWSDAEKADLDDHVRHLLHSRKEGFKRRMRGFGKYIQKREC